MNFMVFNLCRMVLASFKPILVTIRIGQQEVVYPLSKWRY
jgi:hypothetical protein